MPRKTLLARRPGATRPRKKPADNRRQPLLDAAAKLFSSRGFAGTSVRDITAAVGMLSGSMYYHFKSKNEIVFAVHEAGVAHIKAAVDLALVSAPVEPWDRLEAACAAHLEALLGGTDYAQVVAPQFVRALPRPLRVVLIKQRDSYEQLFRTLIDDLPLASDVHRRYLRLAILGSLNWALTWYHQGGDPPRLIAKQILQMFRLPLEPQVN